MKRSSLITTTSHTLTVPGRARSSSKHNRAVSSSSISSSSTLEPSTSSTSLQLPVTFSGEAATSVPTIVPVTPPPHHRRNATHQLNVVTSGTRSSISTHRVSVNLKSPLVKRASITHRRSIVATQHARSASRRISLKLPTNALATATSTAAAAPSPSPSSASTSDKQDKQPQQEQQQEGLMVKLNGQYVKVNEQQQQSAVPAHLLARRASKKLQSVQQARRQSTLANNVVSTSSTSSVSTPPVVRNADPNKNFFSWDEIHQHNRAEDCWVVVHNKVYDVTRFVPYHPGGFKVLGRRAGEDATKDFAYHSKTAKSMIRKYHIGQVGQPGKGDEACVVQ